MPTLEAEAVQVSENTPLLGNLVNRGRQLMTRACLINPQNRDSTPESARKHQLPLLLGGRMALSVRALILVMN